MTTTWTTNPSTVLPGQIVGAPIRIPHIMLCHAAPPGGRWCGWVRVANSRQQLVELMAERREHEETCQGGLIVTGRGA